MISPAGHSVVAVCRGFVALEPSQRSDILQGHVVSLVVCLVPFRPLWEAFW